MSWIRLDFGEHAGKTLPQIVFADPNYFFSSMERAVFKGRGRLNDEAEELEFKARNIRARAGSIEDPVVEYTLDPYTRKFSCIEVIPRSQPLHQGSPTSRQDVLDLGAYANDRAASKELARQIKAHLFGAKARVPAAVLDQFFDDDSNFLPDE
jgi:hypothetical protein